MDKEGKIALCVHGGAGPDSERLHQQKNKVEVSLEKALQAGYRILEKSGTAVDAVAESVRLLEDDPLFNAGRGSAFNGAGEIQMDASIMCGQSLRSGAVCLLKNVRNPVLLAKYILFNSNHALVSGAGAVQLAKAANLDIEPAAYFATEYQYNQFMEGRNERSFQEMLKQRIHGTVGAVALDIKGNLAAATSTGGITQSLPGRISDSCLVGAGCYANNKTCAVSGTGDGELLITHVLAHSISTQLEFTKQKIQEACDYIIHQKSEISVGDMGAIALTGDCQFGFSFNSERMPRAWKSSDHPLQVKIYQY